MKAKEYLERYGKDCYDMFQKDKRRAYSYEAIVVNDFIGELLQMVKDRHLITKIGYINAIRELNNKYKMFIKLFEEKYGISLFREWSFMQEMRRCYPELFR